jgi:sugar-specific transcriptional regulator TrmB
MTNNSIDKKQYVEKLQGFGLTAGQAKVYVTLLEHGKELGGTKLALITDMHRQYIYLALPELIELGLIEEVGDGKNKKYKARPPFELEKIGRKRALAASDLARELNAISNIGNEQEFEVIQGSRAVQTYEMNVLNQYTEGDMEYIIGGASSGFRKVMGDVFVEYLDEKERKCIPVKYIGSANERGEYAQYIGKYANQEYRFMAKLPQRVTHMVIRKDSVSFYSFLNPPLVYVIKSPVVAQNYKDFFLMLWEMAVE